MHIPDGFIAPQVYLPAYAACAGLWTYALRRLRRELDEETLPRLAVTTALAFVLMTLLVPLPGGTSVHATGIGMLAVLFGVWMGFLALSLVLVLQALLLGAGGITALPVNALAMGLLGCATAAGVHRALRPFSEAAAVGVAGWAAVVVSSTAVALVLGLQPWIATDAQGEPLFFPFGPTITLPAVVGPAALVGIGEGVLTVAVWRYARSRAWTPAH